MCIRLVKAISVHMLEQSTLFNLCLWCATLQAASTQRTIEVVSWDDRASWRRREYWSQTENPDGTQWRQWSETRDSQTWGPAENSQVAWRLSPGKGCIA